MPYSPEHKQNSRQKIIETARKLFNRHGVNGVSIDEIMAQAGLTRGGFYNHFRNKEELFAESISHFLHGAGAHWREKTGVHSAPAGTQTIRAMIDGYLSTQHFGNLEDQCPMIAMPTDAARAGDKVKQSYQTLLEAMVGLFESNLEGKDKARQSALAMASLCVGGMVLSKSIDDADLADELRDASRAFTYQMLETV